MKKFRFSGQTVVFRFWLLALICRLGYVYSDQEEMAWEGTDYNQGPSSPLSSHPSNEVDTYTIWHQPPEAFSYPIESASTDSSELDYPLSFTDSSAFPLETSPLLKAETLNSRDYTPQMPYEADWQWQPPTQSTLKSEGGEWYYPQEKALPLMYNAPAIEGTVDEQSTGQMWKNTPWYQDENAPQSPPPLPIDLGGEDQPTFYHFEVSPDGEEIPASWYYAPEVETESNWGNSWFDDPNTLEAPQLHTGLEMNQTDFSTEFHQEEDESWSWGDTSTEMYPYPGDDSAESLDAYEALLNPEDFYFETDAWSSENITDLTDPRVCDPRFTEPNLPEPEFFGPDFSQTTYMQDPPSPLPIRFVEETQAPVLLPPPPIFDTPVSIEDEAESLKKEEQDKTWLRAELADLKNAKSATRLIKKADLVQQKMPQQRTKETKETYIEGAIGQTSQPLPSVGLINPVFYPDSFIAEAEPDQAVELLKPSQPPKTKPQEVQEIQKGTSSTTSQSKQDSSTQAPPSSDSASKQVRLNSLLTSDSDLAQADRQADPIEQSPAVPRALAPPVDVPAEMPPNMPAETPMETTAPQAAPLEVATPLTPQPLREISINFNNVLMVEYIRFISRISGKNFIFDEEDLQFNVTIVSEEPTSIENLMTALLQELRIRDLSIIEQGNNIIIHRNPRVRAPGHIIAEGIPVVPSKESEIITRVFRLNTLDPVKASEIIRPLLSDEALIEVLRDSNKLIITDLIANINKISQLLTSLDAPNSGVILGQYAVRNTFADSLIHIADRILQPIAQGNPYVLVPDSSTNSIFVVSNPFIVEKALAILESLDMNEGITKIMPLDKLRVSGLGRTNTPPGKFPPELPSTIAEPLPEIQVPGEITTGGTSIPPGVLPEERGFIPGGVFTQPRWIQEIPPGRIERTLFFIYKLKFRRGDQIEIALRRIADSLLATGTANEDLVAAINSAQWLETSNSLIFTGTATALDKVREFLEEFDIPLRQVYIEVLILDTTIADSLTYGVEWGTRFGGPNSAGAQGFVTAPFNDPLTNTLDQTTPANPVLDPRTLAPGFVPGFNLGVVGRHIIHHGLAFNSIAALVTAIHSNMKTNIIMSPKILTEDNNTAEIFVGRVDRFKVQSISNDEGNVITNNFQFLDTGTTLRVTPLIGNNGIITLDIVQEITNEAGTANTTPANPNIVDVNLVPILTKSRTITRVHVPDGYFVVLSGMISDTDSRAVERVPCLGGIPLIGALNKRLVDVDSKRNLMIFLRPVIVDTEEQLENITKRQQDVFREKSKFRRSWNYEIDQALDFLNIRPADPDEIGCTVK